jgi:hypothetical protein
LHPKKLKMPQSGQDKPNDDNAPWKSWRGEELADRQEVRDAGNSQRSEKGRSTSIAPVAGTDGERHAQDGAEQVDSGGRA